MTIRPRIFVCALLSVAPLFAAEEHGQLDASEALFTVLAAANAAGYDAGLATSPELRRQVRDRIDATKAPVISELKAFYLLNKAEDKTSDLSRFISLGLTVQDPPSFEFKKRQVEVPPDALALEGFRALLARFYEEASIHKLWLESQTAIERAIEQYQEPVSRGVLESNSYLRNPTSGFLGRRFQIYIDLLGAPNQVQTRSFGDDFFVVLTPSKEPRTADIRHAYLRYLIDPWAIKYGMELKRKSSVMDIAEGAPLLREPYRSNFDLMATECLIRAIESRLGSNKSLVGESLRAGFVLTPYFAEKLAIYEKQPESMRLYFPEMIEQLDVSAELRRLEGVKFDQAEKSAQASSGGAAPVAARSPSALVLERAEEFYSKGNLGEAKKLYDQALKVQGSAPEHADAYYGLARVAVRQNEKDDAVQLFAKTLESSPEPVVEAWSYYYLGKLAALAGDPEEAKKRFGMALNVKGASAKALEASKRELNETK